MLMPFTESLISCGLAAIADLELPSKLYLVEGIVVNLLKNFGLGKITSAAFGVCKAMGGILDTLDNLSLGILGNVIEPVKKLMSLLPLPDCSANSIKGTVKCGSRISVKLPSSLNAKECFKHVRTTCSLTKANKGPALVDLFETIGCLSGKAFDATTPEGLTGLACSVLTGWAKSARVIDLNSLLPFPLPLPGLGGGSSSSSSGDKDESKGLVSDVLGAVTDPLSILKAHDSDSGSSGLISTVLDAVSDPLSILKPHDSDSGSGGLISNVLDAVTDPLSILKPTDSDSGGSGLISNVLEAVTDPLSILKPHDSDSANKGLISNALGAVTDPLSILKPQDDVSSDDKSHGLLSSVFDAVTPNNDDDSKSKGLFSGLIDAGIHPISDSDSTSSDDSHTSASDDKEKPKGLISGMLDAITSPLQSHDSDKKGDSDTDDSATEDKQPHGLLSNVFGLAQAKVPVQRREQFRFEDANHGPWFPPAFADQKGGRSSTSGPGCATSRSNLSHQVTKEYRTLPESVS
ncbi:hypothetical protein MRX96_029016 [Rhipicephalus microplus]